MMHDDTLLNRMQAEEDQAQAALLHVATRLGMYRKYLILEGIPEELALDFVAEYHQLLLSGFGQQEESE